MTRTLILIGACLLLAGCPKPKTSASPKPPPPGSVSTSGAQAQAKQWIRSGGKDATVLLPKASKALADYSMTTAIDLKGRAIKSVKVAGAASRGPGQTGVKTFKMHDGQGGVTYSDVATYDVTFELLLEGGGGSEEVTVSLRPVDGRWYVVGPAPRK